MTNKKTQKFGPTNLEDVVAAATEADAQDGPTRRGLPTDEALGVWRQSLEHAVEAAWTTILAVRAVARSPIEERFLAALWAARGWGDEFLVVDEEQGIQVTRGGSWETHDYWVVRAQHPVGPYRADFQLELVLKPNVYPKFQNGHRVAVAIELDGHDFHEKTKAQAAHDKKRDRYFTAQGLAFLRFTGSEVFRDGAACARETFGLLSKRMQQEFK